MKAATVNELKQELSRCTSEELFELCVRLSKFKKENKELLTYLLYEASDEEAYIRNVKAEIHTQFELVNKKTYYLIKKSAHKILRITKKYIRYSKKKETEVELLIFFCSELLKIAPAMERNVTLHNLYNRQIAAIKKKISSMHEDLQYDYQMELDSMG